VIALVLITIGTLLAVVEPIRRELAWRRWRRTAQIGNILREGVPMAGPEPTLENLVVRADTALARDELLRGVAGVAEIYDRA
jgi:hypothetical protein